MRHWGLLLLLSLAGCGQTPGQKAEDALGMASAAQTNARNGLSRISDLESEVSDLQSEKGDMEAELARLKNEIAQLRSEFESYKDDSVQWHHKHVQ